MKDIRDNQDGMAWPLLILLVALIAAVIIIVIIPGYRQHLIDAGITADAHSVATAKEVALVTYLQEGESQLTIYYYDELTHQVCERDQIDQITPYGRTDRSHNLLEETGAKGVPNDKQYRGKQLLALAVDTTGIVNVRWTGKHWTYQDYLLMDQAEIQLLKSDDYREMDSQSRLQAVTLARQQYDEDYQRQLSQGADPGDHVYWYDASLEEIYADEDKPEIASYRLSGGKSGILKITVNSQDARAEWIAS